MLFTWDVKGLCIIFRWWRVTGPISLTLSLLAIVALCALYEGVRELSRRVEARHAARISAFGTTTSTSLPPESCSTAMTESGGKDTNESSSLLGVDKDRAERRGNIIRAGLYAVQVFYSFFIMLLFMTYQGHVVSHFQAHCFRPILIVFRCWQLPLAPSWVT
jgi:solute carrier family 31 (copper transporter), member 1